ncbi:acetyltransferase (GNAT) family protein [Shewanella psychrophila]|uniref:Acetyltransferase (GNAT) family protein n=1 Tax=Shewanella psychrophila TaxID=225848 RepID=A0A1S6HNM8_9GAMM|nr:GNAT family N-acetyltransferase [Shewanella psychrophila]AQS37120.1 acetyltransferase (GNAT) family protein [Shewanella psychrophila]
MLEIKSVESLSEISELKQQYFSLSTAPLDGMWHFGFAPMSAHFAFYENHIPVGFCCINGEGYMLQFYLSPRAKCQVTELFTLIAEQNCTVIGRVAGAFVSTAENDYLSLCLDNSSSFKVNALMYQQNKLQNIETREPLEMILAGQEQLNDFVSFAAKTIGAPELWLLEYFGNLIQRKELWGYWCDRKLLATGECRLFDDYQTNYADLGMIVAKSERGKGAGTRVLYHLINQALKQGLIPICSTESSNLAAQKIINRAGLSSANRIIQFEFSKGEGRCL